MAKSLIIYFSQNGTTAKVAESIAAGLRREQFEVDLSNIRDNRQLDINGYDLLGIGSPVYVYRPPFNVMDTLNSLPSLKDLPVFTFLLHGTYAFDTAKRIWLVLNRKGARHTGNFQCYGADFYLGYLKEGYLFSPDHPTPEELSLAETFGKEVAQQTVGHHTSVEESQAPSLVYRLERFLLNRWLIERVYSHLIKVDKKLCSACGLCMKLCPRGNIKRDKDGYPKWGRDCLLCQICEIKCPKDAITTPVSWPLIRPFMLYNVRRASRDPSLEYVRVTHSGGQTRRI